MDSSSFAPLGLLLLLLGQAAAGPELEVLSRGARSSACQDHAALHDRLDIVEKRVEDSVLKLESELALLLDAIEAPEWGPFLDTEVPTVDILGGRKEGVASLE